MQGWLLEHKINGNKQTCCVRVSVVRMMVSKQGLQGWLANKNGGGGRTSE